MAAGEPKDDYIPWNDRRKYATKRGYTYNIMDESLCDFTDPRLSRSQIYAHAQTQILNTINDIDDASGRTIGSFVIGKTFAGRADQSNFDYNDPTTWKDNGLIDRWTAYERSNYDGIAAIGVYQKVPSNLHDLITKENCTLLVEGSAIEHYAFQGDGRLYNQSFSTGGKWKTDKPGGVVYCAFKFETTRPDPLLEEDNENLSKELEEALKIKN